VFRRVRAGNDDPFERLLTAQAYLDGMVLGTQNRLMRSYGFARLGLE
jgi:hypothetical protein